MQGLPEEDRGTEHQHKPEGTTESQSANEHPHPQGDHLPYWEVRTRKERVIHRPDALVQESKSELGTDIIQATD